VSQIKVELVKSCCDDLDTVDAARVSFANESWWDELGKLKESDAKLIKYLAAHRHMTPFRHNFVKLRVKAPIFLARQLGKHQAGLSWNEVSRRYVKDSPAMYHPDDWRKAPEGSIKQGSGGTFSESEDLGFRMDYVDHMRSSLQLYKDFMDRGVAPEMARMVLPQSMTTEWIWSGNLLAFAHVYNERIAAGAQQEAQDFAKQLNEAISHLAPVSWEALTNG